MTLGALRGVQSREVHQLLDSGLAAGAGDGTGANVVHVIKLWTIESGYE